MRKECRDLTKKLHATPKGLNDFCEFIKMLKKIKERAEEL